MCHICYDPMIGLNEGEDCTFDFHCKEGLYCDGDSWSCGNGNKCKEKKESD